MSFEERLRFLLRRWMPPLNDTVITEIVKAVSAEVEKEVEAKITIEKPSE